MAKVKEGTRSDLSRKADGLVYLQMQVSKKNALGENFVLPAFPCFFNCFLPLLITANIPRACNLRYGGKKNKRLRQENGKRMPIEQR